MGFYPGPQAWKRVLFSGWQIGTYQTKENPVLNGWGAAPG
jgi:hypothetical protein